MSLHSHFLLTKAIRRSLSLISILLILGLLISAGVFETPAANDLASIREPNRYWEDGWRIVRFIASITAILLSSSLYPRQANRYAVYLISRDYAKSRFVVERMVMVLALATIAYAVAIACLIWIGNLFAVRFAIAEPELQRIAYG